MARKPQPTAGVTVTDETRAVADLRPDPKNARKHSEAQIVEIMRSVEEFGFVERIVVRPDGQIIGGEGRWLALQRLGRDQAECRVVTGLDETGYRRLALALNRIGENSRWDDDLLRELLGEMREAGDPLDGIGFADREIERLLAGEEPIEVREIETDKVDDEFWISCRGPLAEQAGALKALQDVMRKFPSVTVDLGTIALG